MKRTKRYGSIYAIVNRITGDMYIGGCGYFYGRFNTHRYKLRRNNHYSRKLQLAWNEYGSNQFDFRKLIICTKNNVLFYEQRALDYFRPSYNTLPSAGSSLGYKASATTREKLSKAHLGIRHTVEAKAKISLAQIGRVFSADHIAKIAQRRRNANGTFAPSVE